MLNLQNTFLFHVAGPEALDYLEQHKHYSTHLAALAFIQVNSSRLSTSLAAPGLQQV
jgi:hypothetical protein